MSRTHCRLWNTGGKVYIEDLGSTNGTFVNNQRVSKRREITSTDLILLGKECRVGWPTHFPIQQRWRVRFIGRALDNDVVIDNASVSEYHARLLVDERQGYYLEDMNSSNGTRIVGRSERIARCRVQPEDSVRFGDHVVGVASLLTGV